MLLFERDLSVHQEVNSAIYKKSQELGEIFITIQPLYQSDEEKELCAISHSEGYGKEQHLSPSVALFFCWEYPILAPDKVVSLCQYICSDIGEHVINIQSIHHYPDGDCCY